MVSPAIAPVAGPTRDQLLGRTELLWSECRSGLAASKAPIRMTKAGGSAVEIPGGDLRARAGFIRAASPILRLQGELIGELGASRQPATVNHFFVEALLPRFEPAIETIVTAKQDEETGDVSHSISTFGRRFLTD
jgi:hypothetical protein